MLDSPADIRLRISHVEKARVDEAINAYTLSETVVFFIFSPPGRTNAGVTETSKIDFPYDTRVARTSRRKTLSSERGLKTLQTGLKLSETGLKSV